MKGKGRHASQSTHRGSNLSSKQIGMYLKKFKLLKYTNLINVSREAVIVDIKLSETSELIELCRNGSRQIIEVEINKDEITQALNNESKDKSGTMKYKRR